MGFVGWGRMMVEMHRHRCKSQDQAVIPRRSQGPFNRKIYRLINVVSIIHTLTRLLRRNVPFQNPLHIMDNI